jgi:hypothetical protein
MENQEPRFRKVEAKKSKMHPGGLKDWVENEKWVDIRRKNKKGKFEPCGRNDTSKGEKPVCVPINKAKNLTEKEIKNRKRQKARKEKEPNPGKKPNTTKYTEQAGGKSNVSNNNNIRFIGSMIPLSELRPTQPNLPKFIKISGIEDEGGLVDDSEMPMGVNPFDNHHQKVTEEIKDMSRGHDAVEYVASVYKDLISVLKNSMSPEHFEEVTTFNLDDLKKNIDYDKFVNMVFENVEDPYDQHLALVLDLMKDASKQFNIFQWKTHYAILLMKVMKGVLDFEMNMMRKMREERS